MSWENNMTGGDSPHTVNVCNYYCYYYDRQQYTFIYTNNVELHNL